MNEYIAKKRALELFGKQVDKWTIGKYIGSGKTAFVCEAYLESSKYAIKIFENDQFNSAELKELESRLERQVELIGKSHPNLIKIFGGGQCSKTNCSFLVMEFIEAPSLNMVINMLPRERIKPLISQIAAAAKYLEELNLVHRDIKPENIVVLPDYSRAVLLDLGVMRPLGNSDLTDETNTLRFVGTLRYSSPEFLLRNEEHTIEGWRALTFYQIGAVLHDMIMRYPIFNGSTEPFARLVHAIDRERPIINAEDVDPSLITLAQLCLQKNPKLRTELVNWKKFEFRNNNSNNLAAVKERINNRIKIVKEQIHTQGNKELHSHRHKQIMYDVKTYIETAIREICVGNTYFPNVGIESKELENNQLQTSIEFTKSQNHCLTKKLIIQVNSKILDYESRVIKMECIGFLCDQSVTGVCEELSPFYEGIIEKDDSKSKIEEVIYLMFDHAQHKCNSGLQDLEQYTLCYQTIVEDSKEVS